jgi:hypothetical protein
MRFYRCSTDNSIFQNLLSVTNRKTAVQGLNLQLALLREARGLKPQAMDLDEWSRV